MDIETFFEDKFGERIGKMRAKHVHRYSTTIDGDVNSSSDSVRIVIEAAQMSVGKKPPSQLTPTSPSGTVART
jgi:hypothetical protein